MCLTCCFVEIIQLDLFDFETASEVTGSKFVYLKNEAALLEFALSMWALDKLRRRGWTVVLPPDLARHQIVEGELCDSIASYLSLFIYSVCFSFFLLIPCLNLPCFSFSPLKFIAGCGFQPRDVESSQVYSIERSDLCLAGTSEITLAGMKASERQP